MNPDLAVALTERINRAVHSTVGVVESGEAAELAEMLRAASAWTAKTMENVEPTSEFNGVI